MSVTFYTSIYLYLFLSLYCYNNQISPLMINKGVSYLSLSYLFEKTLQKCLLRCRSSGENVIWCPIGCPSSGENVIKCPLECPSSGENAIQCHIPPCPLNSLSTPLHLMS